MAKVGKRSYPALLYKTTGIWYTGYALEYNMDLYVDRSDKHEVRELSLQYAGYQRGRSAANIEMVDEQGQKYLMSMSGFDLLMKLCDGTAELLKNLPGHYDILRKTCLNGGGVWFCGSFCQTKQGQNYFIEPAEI